MEGCRVCTYNGGALAAQHGHQRAVRRRALLHAANGAGGMPGATKHVPGGTHTHTHAHTHRAKDGVNAGAGNTCGRLQQHARKQNLHFQRAAHQATAL